MKARIAYMVGMALMSFFLLWYVFGLSLDLAFVTVAIAGIASAIAMYWDIVRSKRDK
jgi:mannose/fructose/N-acetylgalactosamine-specific phosphotransferase system component IIC